MKTQFSYLEFKSMLQTHSTDVLKDLEESYNSLDEAALNWKSNSEKWSALECIQHLNLYSDYYNPCIKSALKNLNSSTENNTRTVALSWLGKWSIKSVHPENLKAAKTLKHMNPGSSKLDSKKVISTFVKHQKERLRLLEKIETYSLEKAKIPIEFMKWLKINAADCLYFLAAHEQRHLNQANEMLTKFQLKS